MISMLRKLVKVTVFTEAQVANATDQNKAVPKIATLRVAFSWVWMDGVYPSLEPCSQLIIEQNH